MITLLALIIAATAMQDPPPDPACPQADLAFERRAGSTCIGRLTGGYAFSSIWPAEAAAIAGLDALLRRDAATNQRWIAAETRRYRADRGDSEGEPMRLYYESGWTLEALTPALAAVSSTHAYYTGGAHGGMRHEVILFDRARGRAITLPDLFADRRAGMAAVQEIFCPALTTEVSERRDGNVEGFACPDAASVPISLVGSDRGITAMRALIAPYVVGSWAEGPYEVEFPVTNGMRAALKRDYQAAFPGNEVE
jgi:hypothetical protein